MAGENVKVGVVGLVALLLGFGGSLMLSVDELDMAYYCTVTEEYGVFAGGISGTAYTAYPFSDSRRGYERCVDGDGLKGRWVPLREEALRRGVDLDELITSLEGDPVSSDFFVPSKDYGSAEQFSCDQLGCIKIR